MLTSMIAASAKFDTIEIAALHRLISDTLTLSHLEDTE